MTETFPAATIGESVDPMADQDTFRLEQFRALDISEANDERIAQLRLISGAGLMDLATRVHEIVAPEESHTPHEGAMHVQAPDGSSRQALMAQQDRQKHLDYAAGLVRQLVEMPVPDETSKAAQLRRVANVLALGLVQAHAFSDGNGRTARTVAQLVREGVGDDNSEAQADLLLASQNRPSIGFRINSFVPTGEGLNLSPSELLDRAAALDVPLSNEADYRATQQANFSSPYPD